MKKLKNFKEKIENNILFKSFKIILYVIVILFIIVIAVQKFSDNNVAIGGYRIFMVVSGSMADEYNIGDILISKSVSEDQIKVGDNVTYLGTKNELAGLIVTHKVTKKENRDGVTYFTTKGIANSVADPEITYNQIYGKIIYKTAILSAFGKFMNNQIAYYLLFFIIALVISIEIISSMFAKDEDDE